MWFETEKVKKEIPETKEVKEVKCETCKHKIDIEDAQEVKKFNFYSADFGNRLSTTYYCNMHQLSYTKEYMYFRGSTYYKHIPAHDEQVFLKKEKKVKK